ncbi:MAG: PEP-CTERM sorting domain-containing protein [Armatimonadota bacterium]
MKNLSYILMASILLTLLATSALAAPITVDGDDADWASPLHSHDDAVGDVSIAGYDIDWTYTDYDEAADRIGFMTQTVAPMEHFYSADSVEYIINADADESTGAENYKGAISGADYRIWWGLDGQKDTAYDVTSADNVPVLSSWNATDDDWDEVSGLGAGDLRIAWGDQGTDFSIIEATLNPDFIGGPSEFNWVCYLDNGGTSADDVSPGELSIDGDDDSPEPATWVLLAATAAFGALRRRRA